MIPDLDSRWSELLIENYIFFSLSLVYNIIPQIFHSDLSLTWTCCIISTQKKKGWNKNINEALPHWFETKFFFWWRWFKEQIETNRTLKLKTYRWNCLATCRSIIIIIGYDSFPRMRQLQVLIVQSPSLPSKL